MYYMRCISRYDRDIIFVIYLLLNYRYLFKLLISIWVIYYVLYRYSSHKYYVIDMCWMLFLQQQKNYKKNMMKFIMRDMLDIHYIDISYKKSIILDWCGHIGYKVVMIW